MSGPATIRRGGSTVRRNRGPARRRGTGRPAIRTPARVSRALVRLPVSPEALRQAGRMLLLALLAVAAVVALILLKVPQMVGNALGEMAGKAGFVVRSIEIKGIHHMDRLPVYDVALDQESTAMPLVDLDAIRDKLLKFGWVQDARVSRRLPDTLVVDIVERTPAAIWQNHGNLMLIDKDGVELAPVPVDKMPDLPLLIGPDANRQTAALNRLLDAAPGIRPTLAGATWVGGRRWNLEFQSGETLMLPEGDDLAVRALKKFERLDQAARLLGRGYVHFDMRLYPQPMYVRVTRDPGRQIVQNAAPAKPL
jgi:cell division protein FtsQ